MRKTQKETVYEGVKKILGKVFEDGIDVRPHFWPQGSGCFPAGPRMYATQDNPKFLLLLKLTGLSRNTVCNWLRRDPRLNGGKKRNWKGIDGTFRDSNLLRLHSLIAETKTSEVVNLAALNEIHMILIKIGCEVAKIDLASLPGPVLRHLKIDSSVENKKANPDRTRKKVG